MFRRETVPGEAESSDRQSDRQTDRHVSNRPEFGGSEVEVVDGVEVHVLSVPSKGGLPHPEVEVGSVDSRNSHSVLVHHSVKNGG